MNYRRITVEQILYLSALVTGVFVRLVSLGRAPLSDFEATWAFQAWQVSQGAGDAGVLGANPAYILITALLFKIFGSSEFLARLAPALAGSGLVVLPWMYRKQLGRTAAVVLAFGLALDPGLVSQSRLAGSGMLAFAFLFLALGLAFQRLWPAAGVLAALALLSGPAAVHGVVMLILASLAILALPGMVELRREITHLADDPGGLKSGGLAFAATALLGGTLLFLQPSGLSAWFAAIPAYFSGWTAEPAEPVLKLLILLVTYQPLALVFGVIGLGRGLYLRRRESIFLGIWLLIAAVLTLIYPGRQSGDLIWVLLPLWALAARELGDDLGDGAEPAAMAYSQAALILVMMGLFWLNLAGMANSLLDTQALSLRLAVMTGVLVLGSLTTALVGMGWSWRLARWGATMGVTAGLGIYMLAGLSGAALLRSDESWSSWQPAPGAGDAGLFIQTIEQLSLWKTGESRSLDILAAVDSPGLRWALRHFPQAQFAGVEAAKAGARTGAGVADPASVVITRQAEEAPELASSYRGQDFVWWSYPDWQSGAPPDSLRWLAYHSQTWWHEKIILWARIDLFPGELEPGGELIVPEELPEEEFPFVPPEELQEP
jgi:hypothetical protein